MRSNVGKMAVLLLAFAPVGRTQTPPQSLHIEGERRVFAKITWWF